MSQPFLDVEASIPEDACGGAGRPHLRTARLVAGVSLAVVGCCAAGLGYTRVPCGQKPDKVPALRRLQDWPGSATSPTTVEGFQQPPQIDNALNAYFDMMMGPPASQKQGSTAPAATCLDNEELVQNLCYMTCSLLTNGSFPLRTSAWTCCNAEKASDCFIKNQDRNLGLCSGYDVAGDGKSCPRAPGQCLSTEEFFGGQCYQKCSLLTNGTHPHRTSAFSCCNAQSSISCFMPSHVSMSTGYTAGGGAGATATAHQPLGQLTPAPPTIAPTWSDFMQGETSPAPPLLAPATLSRRLATPQSRPS